MVKQNESNEPVEEGVNKPRQATPVTLNRRKFLTLSAGIAGASAASGLTGINALVFPRTADAVAIGPINESIRVQRAYALCESAAAYYRNLPLLAHPDNGDEALYPNKIGSFTKAMPHNALGEVDLAAYAIYKQALETGSFSTFETIPLGGTRKLQVPQAAFAYDMIGHDSHDLAMRPAPAFSSAENAAEVAELYWQALTRDIPFTEYNLNPQIQSAAADLSRFSDFRGPKRFFMVTADTLFRGDTPGDLTGPYISQFLLQDIPFGPIPVPIGCRPTCPVRIT